MRSATFTLRNPEPTGVVMGPLMATRVSRMASSTCGGSGVPYFSITSAPASASTQSMSTPVAAMATRAAAMSSGPVPSPGMQVIRYAIRPSPPYANPMPFLLPKVRYVIWFLAR
ncbi:MAG: hypothetical protein BWY79_01483 [Actinobacteria bacterium ADurb.Bin444]|nr:MAG: hypothetical protein BWY79_01483 [Actinobacteria bacterium ADurb.Bin444]